MSINNNITLLLAAEVDSWITQNKNMIIRELREKRIEVDENISNSALFQFDISFNNRKYFDNQGFIL